MILYPPGMQHKKLIQVKKQIIEKIKELTSIINSAEFDKLQYLLKYIGPAVNYLNLVMMDNFGSFLSGQE